VVAISSRNGGSSDWLLESPDYWESTAQSRSVAAISAYASLCTNWSTLPCAPLLGWRKFWGNLSYNPAIYGTSARNTVAYAAALACNS
jgi:hypothetical protein